MHFIWWRRCQFKFRWMLNQYSSKMRLNQSFWPEWIPLIWRSLKEPHPGLNFFLPEKKIKTGFSIFFNHRLPGSSISALPPLQYNVAVCYMVIIWHVRSERELYLVYVRTYVCLGWPHINDTKLIFGRGWGRRRNTYEDQAHIFSSIHKNKIAHCFKYFPSMRWVTHVVIAASDHYDFLGVVTFPDENCCIRVTDQGSTSLRQKSGFFEKPGVESWTEQLSGNCWFYFQSQYLSAASRHRCSSTERPPPRYLMLRLPWSKGIISRKMGKKREAGKSW